MSNLVVVGFEDEHKADEVLLILRRLQHEYLIDLADAAVVIREQDGKVKIRQTYSLTGAGAVGGGFWGALFGLIFGGPLGAIAAGGAGAAAGAVSGKLRDIGIEDDFMKQVGNALEPGTSAIFALVIRSTPDRVLDALRQYHGNVILSSLSRESEDALVEALS